MRTSQVCCALAAFAIPSASAAKAYFAYSWNETAPGIHNLPIQARLGFFYLGGDAATICPDYDLDCPSKNKTIITGPTASDYSSKLEAFWLGILDRFGQEMVTTSSGTLQYTLEKTHLALEAGNAINTPFAVEVDDFSNQTVLRFNGNDWAGCGIDGDENRMVYPLAFPNVYSGHGECTPFKMRLEETNAPAVEYYHRDCSYSFRLSHPQICPGPTCCGIAGDCPKDVSMEEFKKMHNIEGFCPTYHVNE